MGNSEHFTGMVKTEAKRFGFCCCGISKANFSRGIDLVFNLVPLKVILILWKSLKFFKYL